MSGEYADRIDAESFAEWYREREWARNIREGRPYFNGPSPVPPPEKHSPSQLVQCHRKLYYRKANAPAERPEPTGIFWTGTRFEEDVALPYLEHVVGEDAYVRNSMWVDFTEETDDDRTVRFKGATDPCIVDRESEPLLVTEIKSKEEVDQLEEPNRHHRAQAHAYLRGLSEKYDREVDEAVILYGGRKHLNVRAFSVAFDDAFWREVVEWAAQQTAYRDDEVLPPADPEYGWECRFCDYRHRCGESDEPYADEGARGFLPGFDDYPRERVREYLRAHDDAVLTPSLIGVYPEIEASDSRLVCDRCGFIATRSVDSESEQPVCPDCADRGELGVLVMRSDSEP